MLQHGQIHRFTGPIRAVVPASAKPARPPCIDSIFEAGLNVKPATIRKNKDIIIAGNRHRHLYVNHDGWLSRYKVLHNGARQIVDFILPGEIFGLEACLFRSSLYSVVAITSASLSIVPFEMIDDLFERNPKLSRALFWSTVYEAAILGQHLIGAARRSAYERMSHLLLELFVRLRRAGLAEDMSFSLPLTQELIGDALGLTTVHVNRTLRSLRDDKLIAVAGRRITLLDFEALCLVCDFDTSYLGADRPHAAEENKAPLMFGAAGSLRKRHLAGA